MRYRVIQWATGGVGRAGLEGIVAHPELELVGVRVYGTAKVGRDAGELAGLAPLGVTATDDVDALLAIEADCVHYAPVVAKVDEVIRILESGKNIVTPLGWFYRGTKDGSRVEAACQKGGVTLHGAGIHPGGVTERFPFVVSGMSRDITFVRAEEWSDLRTYGAPHVVGEIMLFGKTPEEATKSPVAKLMGEGFCQSIDMVADALGFDVEAEKRITHEVSTSRKPVDSPLGIIEPGLVMAQRYTWEALVRGQPVIQVTTNWFMGPDGFESGWGFGLKGIRFEAEVRGNPSSSVTFHGWHPETIEAGLKANPGMVTTPNHGVSAIPAVGAARPGIKSYLDLPLYTGRAAAALARA